jgi:hypothetical protein
MRELSPEQRELLRAFLVEAEEIQRFEYHFRRTDLLFSVSVLVAVMLATVLALTEDGVVAAAPVIVEYVPAAQLEGAVAEAERLRVFERAFAKVPQGQQARLMEAVERDGKPWTVADIDQLERERDDYKDRWETLGRVSKRMIERQAEALREAVDLLDAAKPDLTDPALRRTWARQRKALRLKWGAVRGAVSRG